VHEMSLAERVLQIIDDAACVQGFTRVRKVWLEIGQLACVEQDSMRFCFDEVVRDCVADGAHLEIIDTAGRGRCVKCAFEMPIVVLHEACPNCGSHEILVTAGDAMRVMELEVE